MYKKAGAILLLMGLTFATQAETFTAQKFLDMSGEQKNFWLHGSMLTLVQVASAHSKKAGQCVHDWYFTGSKAQKHGIIEGSFNKYPDKPTTSVLIALTEHYCGKYVN